MCVSEYVVFLVCFKLDLGLQFVLPGDVCKERLEGCVPYPTKYEPLS